jgi:hypothetical protein
MQKVHVLLQPTEIATLSLLLDPRPFQQDRQRADVVGAEHHIDPGRALRDRGPVLLRQAAADSDLHAGAGVLDREQVAEIPVQAVVGVFPDCAGIEDHDVRIGPRGSPLVAS